MSYQQKGTVYAEAPGVCLLTQASNLTMSVGLIVKFTGATAMKGSLHTAITLNPSGSITLPQGHYYYLEGAIQGYFASVTDPSDTATALYQWHDSSGNPLGSRGQVKRQYQGSDSVLTTADEKAIHLVDATGGDVEVSLRVLSFTKFTHVNYTADQYIYAGLGRALAIQLEP